MQAAQYPKSPGGSKWWVARSCGPAGAVVSRRAISYSGGLYRALIHSLSKTVDRYLSATANVNVSICDYWYCEFEGGPGGVGGKR